MTLEFHYPWDRWVRLLRRKKLTLRRGRDYHCQPHSMSVMVRNAAVARGIRVQVLINEDVLTVIKRGAA